MYIYLLETSDENIDYDTYAGYVVVANSLKEAKSQLGGFIADKTAKKVGNYTGSKKKPHIVLEDFRAG